LPSIDGQRLFVFGEDPRVELLRYDQKAQRFDPYLSGLSAGPIDYSIDRNWIAYISYPDMTLWRSRVDGSDKMQLTFPPARAYLPRWSPDGSKIVFMDARFDAPWQIYLVSSSGGSPRALMPPDTGDADPTWTADGKSIVFGKNQENQAHGIYQLDLQTRTVSSISDSNGLTSPRVSPNGRYIAAFGSHESKLMLFDTATRQWSTLAEGGQLGYNEWSHDGKFIYFRESREGAAELVRVRIKDHTVQLVLSLRNLPQLDEPFAGWIGLTPDDAPLVMRNRSVQEFYALDLQFH
jgi:Tol biopolymer transport system component